MSEESQTEKMVKVYIKMRDTRGALKRKYEEEDEKIKAQMEVLESEFLELCKQAGGQSIRTNVGTIIRTTKTMYWTSDWEAMHNFIKEKQAPELLERRISQTAMKEYLQDHPEDFPKGMNVDSKYSVVVRRT